MEITIEGLPKTDKTKLSEAILFYLYNQGFTNIALITEVASDDIKENYLGPAWKPDLNSVDKEQKITIYDRNI